MLKLNHIVQQMLCGFILGCLALPAFAGSNSYAAYINENPDAQSNSSFNPYSTGTAASGNANGGGGVQVMGGQNSMQRSDPVNYSGNVSSSGSGSASPAAVAEPSAPAIVAPANNGSSAAASSSPTIQYSTPAPLVQPASQVGQFNNSTASKPAPYVFVNSQNNINNASKSPPTFTPGLLPANSALPPVPSSGTGPEGSSLLQVAKSIDQGVNSIDQQIANQLTAAQNAKANYEPTSDNFVPVDSGFSALNTLYSTQINAETLWTNEVTDAFRRQQTALKDKSSMRSGGLSYTSITFAPAPNFFDLSFYASGLYGNESGLSSNPITPALSYSLQSLRELYGSGSETPQMAMLENAVLTPLNSDGKWLKQLQHASTPQLLRTIALQNAIKNYLLYQSLRRQSEQELIEMAQLNVLASMHNDTTQGLNKMDNDLLRSQQQTNSLLSQLVKASKMGK